MTPQDIENTLAAMPECKKSIWLWPHDVRYITEQPDWLIAIARVTGSVAVDLNMTPRAGGETWCQDDMEKLHGICGDEVDYCCNYSPFVDRARVVDPATTRLIDISVVSERMDCESPPIQNVVTLLDSERFQVERDDKYVAIDSPHNARIETIHNVFHDIASNFGPVVWYGAHRSMATMTWRERGDNTDSEAYRVFEPDYWHAAVEAAEKKAKAAGKSLVTCWVSLGAGYDTEKKWHHPMDYQLDVSYEAGKWLGARDVQCIFHPHPLSTSEGDGEGVRHMDAFVRGINDANG